MRVLLIVPRISPQSGGPGIALPGLARCLASHGIDTTMLTTTAGSRNDLEVPLSTPVVRDGVTYVCHPVLAVGGRYGLSPALWTALRGTVANHDIVHIHWLYDFACIAAARAAVGSGVPFVIQPNGSLDPHLSKKNALLKRLYLATVGQPLLKRAAAIVFTSEQEREQALCRPGISEWILPVGLDASTFARLPPRGAFRAALPAVDGPFLLFVGRLSRQKGLDLLLGAFARVAREREDLRLVLAGPDPDGYGAHLRALSQRLGIHQRVVFAGLLTHDMKLAAFVDAELFVLPSYAENFGAVTTEALACGLPVVLSDQVNIHREMAAAGVATVVQCSIDSVASGINAALADPTLRTRIATLGPALIHAHYTWDAVVPTYAKNYAEAIAGAAAP